MTFAQTWRLTPFAETSRPVAGVETILAIGIGEFLDRHRFAGQRGLVDEQVLRSEQAQVGRHHVPRGQIDDVAWHERIKLRPAYNRAYGRADLGKSMPMPDKVAKLSDKNWNNLFAQTAKTLETGRD